MNAIGPGDNAQRTLGVWSQIMAGIQSFFFLITISLVPRGSPWEVYIIMSNGILAFFLLGVLLAVLGLTREGNHRNVCLGGAIWGSAIVSISMMFLAINAWILY